METFSDISDFIDDFPFQEDRNIQAEITKNYQFYQFSSEQNEVLTEKYYKHQRFVHDFLEQYDKLAIFDEPGTGKTLTVIGYIESKLDAKRFKNIYILVKNMGQHALEIKKQIICKTSARYQSEILKNPKDENEQRTEIRKLLKKAGYHFYTYGTFASMVNNKFKDFPEELRIKKIKEFFSDSFFWIDEVHNLNNVGDDAYGSEKEPVIFEDQDDDDDEEDVIELKKNLKRLNKEKIYDIISEIFENIERSKIVISSATPMINEYFEIVNVLNLLLPKNNRMPSNYDYKNFNIYERTAFFTKKFTEKELQELPKEELDKYFRGKLDKKYLVEYINDINYIEPFFRGKCSYVKNSNPYVNKIEKGVSIADEQEDSFQRKFIPQMKMVMGKTQSIQAKGYAEAYKKGIVSEDVAQACNLVFPNETYGSAGFNEYVYLDSNTKTYKRNEDFDDFLFENGKERNAVMKQISKLSCKYYNIIKEIIKMSDEGKFGYVYMDRIMGSGLIVLGLLLDAIGYQRFDPKVSIYKSEPSEKGIAPFCKDTVNKKKISESINLKINRYAFLIGGISDTDARNVLEASNASENKNGEIIRILLISRIGRDSISIMNVQKIFLGEGEWNESVMEQAIARGIRSNSHLDLIDKMKNEGVKEPKVNVEIFREAMGNFTYKDQDYNSVDVYKYITSENKDRAIKTIMRIIKITSVSCEIHRHRNTFPPEYNYTKECEYDLCHYNCFDHGKFDGDKNFKTYILNYFNYRYPQIKEKIQELFRNESKFHLDDIYKHIGDNYLKEHIIMTIEKIIKEREIIYNRFGFISFLSYDNDILFLINEFPKMIKYEENLSYYNDKIITTSYNEIELVHKEIGISNLNFMTNESELKNFNEVLKKFNRLEGIFKIEFFENSFMRIANGKSYEIDKYVLRKYKNFIYKINIECANKILNERLDKVMEKRKGPKIKEPFVNKKLSEEEKSYVNELIDKIKTDNFVYIHTLHSALKLQNSDYADNSNIINIVIENGARYFNNGKWETMDEHNSYAYVKIAQTLLLNKFQENIVNLTGERYLFLNVNNTVKFLNYSGKKQVGNGVQCETKNSEELEILYVKLLNYIKISGDQKKQKEREFYNARKGTAENSRCDLIKKLLEANNLILDFSL